MKGKSKHGKGRGKSFGKRTKDRDALLQKIACSHCCRCGALGHWKAECPLANSSEKSGSQSAAASANVVVDERPQEVFSTSVEMDEVFSEEDDSYVMPTMEASSSCKPVFAECFMLSHECKNQGIQNLNTKVNSQKTHRPSGRSSKSRLHHGFQARTTVLRKSRDLHPSDTALSSRVSESPSETLASEQVYSSLESFCTHAILDTGASRCIIVEKTLNCLQ